MSQKFTFFSLAFIAIFSLRTSAQQSLTLDGTSGYAFVPQDLVPAGSGTAFTVESWVLVNSLSAGKHYFLAQGSTDQLTLGYDGDAGGKITVGTLWPESNAILPINTWAHIALSVGADNSARLYINGIPSDSVAAGVFHVDASPNSFFIGTGIGLSGFLNGNMDEIRVWTVQRTASEIKKGMYGTVPPTSSGLVAYYNLNESSGNAINTTSPGVGDATLENTATRASSPIQSGNNAMNFVGGHTKVVVPNTGNVFDLTTGTIELVVTPSALTFTGDMIGVRGAGGSRFNFDINASGVSMWNGSGVSTVPYTFTVGNQYQLAFVSDGTATTVYVNGTAVPGYALSAFGTTAGQPLVIGLSNDGGNSDGEPYSGDIDEVRIWSTQRTAGEISANQGVTLTGDESGLIALYSFDQGVVGGDNSFLTTIIDNSPNNLHGTAQNFALSGTTSNFVTSSVTNPLPVNFIDFTAAARGKGVLLQWQTAQEQNSSHFTIQHSTDGRTYSDIGSVAAAGNSTTAQSYSFTDGAPASGMNFYRLKEVDLDNKFMYSVIRTVQFTTGSGQLSWFSTGNKSAEVILDNGNAEWYTVTNMNGQVIRKGQLSAGKLYLNQLAAGIYIVNVVTRQTTQTAKVEIF